MAPGKSVAVLLPARYVPGERIGNVDRDVAAILKYYMDDDFDVLLASNCYNVGFCNCYNVGSNARLSRR